MTHPLEQAVGRALAPSRWHTVTQGDVDAYSRATGDADWLHNDPDRAATAGAYGGTIVPGFMQLALCTQLIANIGIPGYPDLDLGHTLNYGLDHARFIRPLLVGSDVRLQATIKELHQQGQRVKVRADVQLEVDDAQGRPSMVAQWLFLLP